MTGTHSPPLYTYGHFQKTTTWQTRGFIRPQTPGGRHQDHVYILFIVYHCPLTCRTCLMSPLRMNPLHLNQHPYLKKQNGSIPSQICVEIPHPNWINLCGCNDTPRCHPRSPWGLKEGRPYMQRSLEQPAMKDSGLTNSWQLWNGGSSITAQTSSTFCSHQHTRGNV